MERRVFSCCFSTLFLALVLVSLCILSPVVSAQEVLEWDSDCEKLHSSNDTVYDWEHWDYYQLLGLTPSPSLSAKHVRKAYRQQAQLWHPDKQTRTNITKQEANDRFAQLSHAYNVLVDDRSRADYDDFLMHCHRTHGTPIPSWAPPQDMSFQFQWSNWLSKLSRPLRLLEEIWMKNQKHPRNEDEDLDQQWFTHSHLSNHYDLKRPTVVSERQHALGEAYGGEVIRISKTIEYDLLPRSQDKNLPPCFYQVVAQNFVQRLAPYSGDLFLQPLTEQFLLEEGYCSGTSEGSSSSTPDEYEPSLPHIPRQSLLYPDDVLTYHSHLVSPNRRYFAGISAGCELYIVNRQTETIWSSGVPPMMGFVRDQTCIATLKGPTLIVAAGRPDQLMRNIWQSDTVVDVSDDPYSQYPSTFIAQLDNDGSLAVYQMWGPTTKPKEQPILPWLRSLVRDSWKGITRSTTITKTFSYPWDETTSAVTTYKRCIFATGPFGCFRLGRRLHQLGTEIAIGLRLFLLKMDSIINADDDESFDELMASIGDWCIQGWHKCRSAVQRALRTVQDRASPL